MGFGASGLSRRVWLLALAAVLATPLGLGAQGRADPDHGGLTKSMGLPLIWKPYLGWEAGAYDLSGDTQFGVLTDVGVFKDLFNPTIGAAGLQGEAYVGARESGADGGFRALFAVPMIRLGLGADYNLRDTSLDFLVRLSAPIRRSGIIGNGSRLRVNWLPWRGQTVSFGLTVPLGQSELGDTRARKTHATLPEGRVERAAAPNLEPALEEALTHVGETAHWINRLTTPFIDQGGDSPEQALASFQAGVSELQAHFASRSVLFPTGGLTSEGEVRAYHAELERAFSIAASGLELPLGASTEEGRAVAARAKELLVDQVIFPYNRLLGLDKKDDTTLGLARAAESAFAGWLRTSRLVASERQVAVAYVFRRLIEIVEENRKFSREMWGSSRLVWIPLQYSLLPEQHDTQIELNEILERAVGKPFVGGNRIWYVDSREFHQEVGAMLHRAEEYSVLWIHDIQGRNGNGDPDAVTFHTVVQGYLRALIEGARNYDRKGTMPVHLLFFDQHRFEDNKARPWMKLLENPMHHRMSLPAEFAWMADSIQAAQVALREAVAGSRLLQERAAQYGERWLRNRIQVHVSITNPADPTYWSNQLLPAVKWPDNVMRDHRKVAFYDVTEADPYRGMVIYGGMGIGEHYSGPGWEDRGILLQGPAALSIKTAARELLLQQGFSEEEIPFPLQPSEKPADYDEIVQAEVDAGNAISLALELHNETGYGLKLINVLKATLYTLMPPGSVLIIPDSLWNAPILASWLVGNCLRGGRVLIVAPALANAPSNRFAQMSRAQELFTRLILLQQELGPEIAAAGGALKTGLYALDVGAGDVPTRLRMIEEGLAAEPFLREVTGLRSPVAWSARSDRMVREPVGGPHGEFVTGVDGEFGPESAPVEVAAGSRSESLTHPDRTAEARPKLHAKTQFLASAEAWQAITTRSDLGPLVDAFVRQMMRRGEPPNMGGDGPSLSDSMPVQLAVQRAVMAETPPETLEKFVAYLMVGSYNQNYRSMLMDGEVMLTVEGGAVIHGLIDYLGLLGATTWVDDLEELEDYLPAYGGLKYMLARSFREML